MVKLSVIRGSTAIMLTVMIALGTFPMWMKQCEENFVQGAIPFNPTLRPTLSPPFEKECE